MSYYILVEAEVTDPARYAEYREASTKAVRELGGRFLVRGGEARVFEGAHSGKRLVVIEFPSREQAQAWWDSPQYAHARRLRQGAAVMNIIGVEGV